MHTHIHFLVRNKYAFTILPAPGAPLAGGLVEAGTVFSPRYHASRGCNLCAHRVALGDVDCFARLSHAGLGRASTSADTSASTNAGAATSTDTCLACAGFCAFVKANVMQLTHCWTCWYIGVCHGARCESSRVTRVNQLVSLHSH